MEHADDNGTSAPADGRTRAAAHTWWRAAAVVVGGWLMIAAVMSVPLYGAISRALPQVTDAAVRDFVSSLNPIGTSVFLVGVPLTLFCTVYITKRALDVGAPTWWVLLWLLAVLTFPFGVIALGIVTRIRRDRYHDHRNGYSAVAAVAILIVPLSPIMALGVRPEPPDLRRTAGSGR